MELDDYVEEALYSLSQEENAKNRSAEYMSIVYVDAEGNFGHLPPVQLGTKGGAAPAMIPKGTRPVAIIHNHPDKAKGFLAETLSDKDVVAANQLGIPIYALSQSGVGYGTTVKYRPGQTTVGPMGDAKGEPVLALFPIEKFIENARRGIGVAVPPRNTERRGLRSNL